MPLRGCGNSALRARHRLDVPPALEERAPDARHARVGPVVRVRDIAEHLFRRAPVARRERLVPRGEDVLFRLGAGVLDEDEDVRKDVAA